MGLVCWCTMTYAQNKIKGRIIDQDSIPLPGASVFINELNKGTITDQQGNYVLSNLPNGTVKLQYSFIGHTSKIIKANLNDTVIIINESLIATAIEAEEIVVTGGYRSTQHENAVKIDVIKIDVPGNKVTPNFTEMLTSTPGVDMISKGSGVSKPVIRGLSMNDILVLNNGFRFENYQYSSHHPLGIDEFGIEDVEIIKGPASLLYGSDAIGGVINFIKEKPVIQNSIAGDYSLQLFSNTLGMVNNFGIKGATGRFFGGLRAGQKTHADYLQGGGDFVPNSRFREYSLKTNAGFTGKVGTFKVFYDYNQQNLGLTEEEAIDLIAERGRKCGLFYQQLNTHMVSAQNKIFLGRMSIDANVSYQNTGLTHIGEANFHELEMHLGTLTYEARIFLPSDRQSEYILGFQGINQKNKNTNNRETILLPDASVYNYSGFILLQHTFFEKLKLQTGIRYDHKTLDTKSVGIEGESTFRSAINKNYGSFSGSVGLTYNITSSILIRGNIASAYRTPNLAELTSNGQHETRYEIGDISLKPENSQETDISMHFHREQFTLDVAGFRNGINRYIYISPTGETTSDDIPVYQYMQRNAVLYGGEAGLHIHPSVVKWLHFQTTFSAVAGKQKNGEYLPFIPAHKLNAEIQFKKEKMAYMHDVFASVKSYTAFNQHNPAPDETKTDGYSLFDCSIGGNVKAGNALIAFSIGVSNIFDVKYIDHLSTLKEVGLNNPGRNFFLTMNVAFGSARKTGVIEH